MLDGYKCITSILVYRAAIIDTQFTKIDVAIANTGANADAVAKLGLEVTVLIR